VRTKFDIYVFISTRW